MKDKLLFDGFRLSVGVVKSWVYISDGKNCKESPILGGLGIV